MEADGYLEPVFGDGVTSMGKFLLPPTNAPVSKGMLGSGLVTPPSFLFLLLVIARFE